MGWRRPRGSGGRCLRAVCGQKYVLGCVCVCVCVRERERERFEPGDAGPGDCSLRKDYLENLVEMGAQLLESVGWEMGCMRRLLFSLQGRDPRRVVGMRHCAGQEQYFLFFSQSENMQ